MGHRVVLRWSRDRVSCSPTEPNLPSGFLARCDAKVFTDWRALQRYPARFREKGAIWKHPQCEGGAGTRGARQRELPYSDPAARKISRHLAGSPAPLRVARSPGHLPGHHSSVAASPLRCHLRSFARRQMLDTWSTVGSAIAGVQATGDYSPQSSNPRFSLEAGVTPAVHSEGPAPLAPVSVRLAFLAITWRHWQRLGSHMKCVPWSQHTRGSPTPRLIKAVTVYRRATITLSWPPDSECKPTARSLRVGCGFEETTWNESPARSRT